MKFDPSYVAAWYDRLGEGEWDRWERSPSMRIQYAVFVHYVQSTVVRGARVLDAGCGAGRYTARMIELGADVTALDLSPRQLELCRERAPGAERYVLGSVTDLSAFADESFDAVVCLGGPLSDTLDATATALAELVRVTRRGCRMLLSVMGLSGTLHQYLPAILRLDVEENRKVLRTGDLPREVNDGHECHVYRVDELHALLEAAGLVDVELSAPVALSSVHPDLELPAEGTAEFEFLLEAELMACRENPGAGPHIIASGRRG